MPPAYHGNYFAPWGNMQDGAYVYEPLFIYLPRRGRYIGRLATGYQESPDHLTLTVHVKPHVLWQDGSRFTSQDVACTTWVAWATGQDLHSVSSIECPDDETIVYHFWQPSPATVVRTLTRWIAAPRSRFGKWGAQASALFAKHLGPVELSHAMHDLREDLFQYHPAVPIGTGPYMVKRVTASDLELDRFLQYHDADRVHVDQVRLIRSRDNAVAWSLLMAGELDVCAPATPLEVAQEILHENPQSHLLTVSDMSDFGVLFNCQRGPTADVRVRQGLAAFIDRDQVRKLAYPYGTTAHDDSVGAPSTFRDAWVGDTTGWPQYAFDLAKGASLLESAGWRRGDDGRWRDSSGSVVRLEMAAPGGSTDMVTLAEVVATQLARAGLACEVRALDPAYYQSSLLGHNFQLASVTGVALAGVAKPSVAYDRLVSGEIGSEADVGLDRHLAERLDALPDGPEQHEVVRQLARAVDDACFYIPCYEKNLMIFTVDGRRITGWPSDTDEIWQAAPGGIDMLYATLLANGTLRPAR